MSVTSVDAVVLRERAHDRPGIGSPDRDLPIAEVVLVERALVDLLVDAHAPALLVVEPGLLDVGVDGIALHTEDVAGADTAAEHRVLARPSLRRPQNGERARSTTGDAIELTPSSHASSPMAAPYEWASPVSNVDASDVRANRRLRPRRRCPSDRRGARFLETSARRTARRGAAAAPLS